MLDYVSARSLNLNNFLKSKNIHITKLQKHTEISQYNRVLGEFEGEICFYPSVRFSVLKYLSETK